MWERKRQRHVVIKDTFPLSPPPLLARFQAASLPIACRTFPPVAGPKQST